MRNGSYPSSTPSVLIFAAPPLGARMRALIWRLYDDLKAYHATHARGADGELTSHLSASSSTHGFVALDRLLARLHANDPLLMVLDHPDIPLHTNGYEH